MADRPLSDLLRHLRRATLPPAGVLADDELLRRFTAGHDEAAFEALTWRHGPLVLGVCRRVLGHSQDAEDAFQAAFLVLARKAGSVRTAVGPWLYRVAYRVALRARERSARANRVQPLPADLVAAVLPDEMERRDLKRLLDEELQRLPAKYRDPVVLHHLEGWTTAEVAGALGCPTGTMLSRLDRARQRLRARLAARGVALSAAVAATAGEVNAVPARWVVATAGAALRFSGGGRSALSITRSALLAEGVLRAMWMTKLRLSAVLALGVLVTGAGLMVPGRSAVPPDKQVTGADPLLQERAAVPPDDAAPVVDDQPAVVTVSKPIRRDLAAIDDFGGHIEAAVTVEVRPRITGLLEKIAFLPGADVKPGQLLFELDGRAQRVEVDKAQAELQRAEARLRRAETDLGRARQLQANRVVAQEELDRHSSEREEAAAGVRIAQVGVERAKLDLEATRITSPIDGRVGRPQLDAGNVVNPTMILATIVATDRVYAAFNVDERAFQRLRKRVQKAGNDSRCVALLSIGDDEGFPREGVVAFVDDRLDPRTGSARVLAVFPNRGGELVPGMAARVRVVTGEMQSVLLVPTKVIGRAGDQAAVPVFVGGDVGVENRIVTLGHMVEDLRVVLRGLKPDDRIVVGSPGTELEFAL